MHKLAEINSFNIVSRSNKWTADSSHDPFLDICKAHIAKFSSENNNKTSILNGTMAIKNLQGMEKVQFKVKHIQAFHIHKCAYIRYILYDYSIFINTKYLVKTYKPLNKSIDFFYIFSQQPCNQYPKCRGVEV